MLRWPLISAFGLALMVAPAAAQNLQRFDMEQIPLAEINLRGGLFIATLYEDETPFLSQLLLECEGCTPPASALVGLSADTSGEGDAFKADPQAYMDEIAAICNTQAEACTFHRAKAGALSGYGYTAVLADGITIVEEVYFADGLTYVINAAAPVGLDAVANVGVLRDVVTPYVTGNAP